MVRDEDEGAAGLAQAKQRLRDAALAARRERPTDERRAEDAARAAALAPLVAGHAVVALYLAKEPEPDVTALLDVPGVRFLLPVLGRRPDGSVRRDPDWAWWAGWEQTREGIWGIHEPTTPALGAEGLAAADLVICSGLAATPDGWRCGVGGGWYDRALTHVRPGTPVVVALNASEVHDEIPHGPLDRRVDALATGDGLRWASPRG